MEEFLNNPDNETEEFYFTGTVKGPEFMGNYIESEINEKFSSKEEALNYINELETNGYEIINYEFINDKTTEEGRKEETYSTRAEAEAALAEFTREYPNNVQSNIEEIISGTVYDAVTITEDMKIYQIGSTTFVIIKKGNEIFVWTEEELNAEAQAQFKNTYKQVASDPVLTGNAVASNKTKFVYGYNITYTTSNGKHFTFRLENGEVKIDMDSGAESRVVSGTFAPVNQYKLVVTGSKEVDAEEGTLIGTKKEKKLEYYYELVKKLKKYNLKANLSKEILNPKYTVEGTGTNDIKTLMHILNLSKTMDVTNYRIDGKATMDVYRPYWLVTYNSVETIYNTTISYSQNYTVNQIDINREYIAEGEGYYTEPEIIVPKTGINAVNYEYLIVLSAALLAAVNVKYVLKKQK